jgi:hypothetical protein
MIEHGDAYNEWTHLRRAGVSRSLLTDAFQQAARDGERDPAPENAAIADAILQALWIAAFRFSLQIVEPRLPTSV